MSRCPNLNKKLTREEEDNGAHPHNFAKMPIQAPQWTEYLSCPVCEKTFDLQAKRLPISLGCGHTICRLCLSNLQRKMCPFDQVKLPLYLITN